MDDAELLRREIRAGGEKLVRKRSRHEDGPVESASSLPLLPDRDGEFRRLALMSVEELETRVERFERDPADLEREFDELVE